jgi:hypothetical protein
VGNKSDRRRICFFQSIYNLPYYFRGFPILTNREETTERQVNHFSDSDEFGLIVTKLSTQRKMTGKEILGIRETEEGRRIEISFMRVVRWALAFTNTFFVSYFFAKLFRWI